MNAKLERLVDAMELKRINGDDGACMPKYNIFPGVSIELDHSTVYMGQGKSIEGNRFLKTFALAGCSAVAMFTETDGKRQGILTHYPPIYLDNHTRKILELIGEHPEMAEASVKRGVILHPELNPLVPETVAPNSDTRRQVDILSSTISRVLGKGTVVTEVPYKVGVGMYGIRPGIAILDLEEAKWISFAGEGCFSE